MNIIKVLHTNPFRHGLGAENLNRGKEYFGDLNLKNLGIFVLVVLGVVLVLSGSVNATSTTCTDCPTCNAALNNPLYDTVYLEVNIPNQSGTCINDPLNFNNKIFDCQGNTIKGNNISEYWPDAGIYLNGKSGNMIKNCLITNWDNGIHLSNSSNNILTNNTANSNEGCTIYGCYGNGIYLYYSSNNNILTNNTANSNGLIGIYLSSSNNTLTNNTANNNSYGIYVLYDPYSNNNNMMILNDLCYNSEYDVYNYVGNSTTGDNNTCVISYNYDDTNSTGCKYVCSLNEDNCNCSSCKECSYELSHTSCSEVNLTTNIINKSGNCIDNPTNFNNKIFDCQGHIIDGDDYESDYGIYLNGKSENTIKNCVITDFGYGIDLHSSPNNTITNNTADSNWWNGISLLSSSNNNNLTNNTANSNLHGYGISLYYSSNNTMTNNTANNNSQHGFYATSDSNNNTISVNTFCSNNQLGGNYYDIYNEDSSTGDNNTCGITYNYNDIGIESRCTYRCDGTPCDADNDYYVKSICGGTDCNDNNASINPGAAEIYNEIDDNCDGQIDEGFCNNETHYNSIVCAGWSCNSTYYCNPVTHLPQLKKADNNTCSANYECQNNNCMNDGKCHPADWTCVNASSNINATHYCDANHYAQIKKATDIFDVVEMLEYLSGQKNSTQLSNNDIQGYYKFDGNENNADLNLFDVFALIAQIVTEG